MEPEEFAAEVRAFREASALSPDMRERLRRRLVEHLKAPIDAPSWGPDWLNWHELEEAERRGSGPAPQGVSSDEMDSRVIVRNLERSRHVARYMPLYLATAILSVVVAVLAMFVDYQIISGDIWTRALADEFMVVPDSLKGSVMFKSLQVVFAVLAIHFMLKITGVYGRNALISTAFALTVLMVACLGYLVAYNNMPGGTAAQSLALAPSAAEQVSTIDALFASLAEPAAPVAASVEPAPLQQASVAAFPDLSLPFPRISAEALANIDSWLWLVFASVIFLIVTVIAALYMQIAERNLRNLLIARDYEDRRRQYAQLHLLELAARRPDETQ